ncbi:hypothetical protein ACFC1R_34695 [Kitasatospora sp. NPDC056138]|uniref:hypothetical protein n=1 Tax=Kitasatospora sp. NPDC056138 TaxID=3345724 RepID=UPI0035DCE4D3
MARSLTELTEHVVTVTGVSPYDVAGQAAAAAGHLGVPLYPDPGAVVVEVSLDLDHHPACTVVDAAQPGPVVAWRLANALVDVGQEILGSEPFPPCPGHQHPMALGQLDAFAYWCCPQDRERVLYPITTP